MPALGAAVAFKLVSARSLPKTEIFAEKAGDFRRSSPQVRQSGSPETKASWQEAGISGPFSRHPDEGPARHIHSLEETIAADVDHAAVHRFFGEKTVEWSRISSRPFLRSARTPSPFVLRGDIGGMKMALKLPGAVRHMASPLVEICPASRRPRLESARARQVMDFRSQRRRSTPSCPRRQD